LLSGDDFLWDRRGFWFGRERFGSWLRGGDRIWRGWFFDEKNFRGFGGGQIELGGFRGEDAGVDEDGMAERRGGQQGWEENGRRGPHGLAGS
jgi:hypothetical protein